MTLRFCIQKNGIQRMTPRNYPNQSRKHNNYSAPPRSASLQQSSPAFHPNRPSWLGKHPGEIEMVFFDLETTGGNPANSDVIEIAAIKEIRGKQIGRFQTLVNPHRPIPKMVRSITGIDNSMVRDAPPMEEVIDELLLFIGDAVLVSHGVLNDYAFVANYAKVLRNIELKNYYVCTHLVVANFLPNIPTKSLSGVAHYFGLDAPHDAHRAMADAETTQSIFWKVQQACEKNGFKSVEDLLKIQADNQTLNRLGPGILTKDAERAPTTPGLLYMFNLNREVTYVAATQNLRRSLMNLTELCDEREFNKLLVDLVDFKFDRTTHFLAALLREKRELKKLHLPIDPRKYEGRANGFLQILIPEDMVEYARKNPEAAAFELPLLSATDLSGAFDDEPVFEENAFISGSSDDGQMGFVPLKAVPVSPALGYDGAERNRYALQSWDHKTSEEKAVPIRKTRRIISTVRTSKFQFARTAETPTGLNVGVLREGIGWGFGPFEHPKVMKTQFDDLLTLWPFADASLDMAVRFENLQYIVRTLHGQLQQEIDELKEARSAPRMLLRPLQRRQLTKNIDLLEAIKAQNWQLGRTVMPRSGLAIISNNDLKELDLYVVVRGTVRKHTRLSGDHTEKLRSARYFTRLFHEFHDEIENQNATVLFTEENCINLELFAYWLNKRRSEGEWVDFEDLSPLYDPSLV